MCPQPFRSTLTPQTANRRIAATPTMGLDLIRAVIDEFTTTRGT